MAGPPLPSVFTITLVRLDGPVIWLEAQGSTAQGQCPTCGNPSAYLHDRYVRRPFDLPWRGRVVRLRLTVRRFRCPTSTCARQTFAEDFGPTLARYARRTADAVTVLLQFAVAAGGEAGARLARRRVAREPRHAAPALAADRRSRELHAAGAWGR